MSLLRVYDHQQYWPEYGTLVVQDVARPGQAGARVGELLARYAVDTQPSGSLARAGDGWVEGVASGDHRHAVRFEVHDTPPDDGDLTDWADVLDTPFATTGVVRLGLTVGGPIGQPVELGPPGVYRLLFARRPVSAGDDPEGWPCEFLLRLWPTDTPPEPPRWLRRTGLLVDGRPAAERDAFDGSYRRAITDIVMLALWARESATPVTLGWLADRLLTTTATVQDVIEHPMASRVLSVDGDLDDVVSPLVVTVLARKPAEVRGLPVPALQARPGSAARRSAPAGQATPGVRGARKMAARPMVVRQSVPEAEESGTARDQSEVDPGQPG
jgi:hypothetical protein